MSTPPIFLPLNLILSQCWFHTECFPDAHHRQSWEQEEEDRTFSCNISRQRGKCRASCKQFTKEWQNHQGSPLPGGGNPHNSQAPDQTHSTSAAASPTPALGRGDCRMHIAGIQKPFQGWHQGREWVNLPSPH